MSYSSDDHRSSKTPFTGDQTGDIFADTSNLVSQSPITTVRTVETQSGFLVVLKDVEDRTSLSVKRKIGTPPQSHVLLTADEVRKLSRILGGGQTEVQPVTSEFRVSGLDRTPAATEAIRKLTLDEGALQNLSSNDDVLPGDPNVPDGVSAEMLGEARKDAGGVRDASEANEAGGARDVGGARDAGDPNVANLANDTNDAIGTLTAKTHQTSDFSDLNIPARKRRSYSATDDPTGLVSPRRANEKKVLIIGAASLVGLVVLAVVAVVFLFFNYSSSTPPKVVQEIVKHEMSSENVDTFVRAYVANLLDFSPRSYKYSQVQAMSVMKRELMTKYWTETNFPLSRGQLKSLPKNQTVMISKVVQEPTSSVTTDVDLYAELISSKSKEPSPVHLKLGISLNQDGKLVVVSQKDVSSSDAKAGK